MFSNKTFAEFLKKSGKGQEAATEAMRVVEDYQAFLSQKGVNDERDITVKDTVDYLVKNRVDSDDIDHIIQILREYAYSIHHEEVCSELDNMHYIYGITEKMSNLIREIHGEDVWRQVFGDADMPKPGCTLDEATDFTREMDARMSQILPREQCECVYVQNGHGWQPGWDSGYDRKLFLELQSIDKLIQRYNDNLINELETCRDEGKLFYTQECDDEVVAYMKANPSCTRIGNKIRLQKIPFLTKKYLHEKDNTRKRFYACHCPLKRNSILQEKGSLSRSLCNCSLGHDKKKFDLAFGRELTGRVVESVMDADSLRCVFEIELPDDLMKNV